MYIELDPKECNENESFYQPYLPPAKKLQLSFLETILSMRNTTFQFTKKAHHISCPISLDQKIASVDTIA